MDVSVWINSKGNEEGKVSETSNPFALHFYDDSTHNTFEQNVYIQTHTQSNNSCDRNFICWYCVICYHIILIYHILYITELAIFIKHHIFRFEHFKIFRLNITCFLRLHSLWIGEKLVRFRFCNQMCEAHCPRFPSTFHMYYYNISCVCVFEEKLEIERHAIPFSCEIEGIFFNSLKICFQSFCFVL